MKLHANTNMNVACMRPQRRFSYWDKLIVDEDIPFEELHSLNVGQAHNNADMDVYTHVNQRIHVNKMKTSASEFNSEAYLEYRRRVFQQLAAEYDKEKQQQQQQQQQHLKAKEAKHREQLHDNNAGLHSSYYADHKKEDVENSEDLIKLSSDLQPSWDDSDLSADTYVLSPAHDFTNNTLPWQKNHSSLLRDNGLQPEKYSKSVNELNDKHCKQKMNWSSFDEQIKLKATKADSDESLRNNTDNTGSTVSSPTTPRQWKNKKNSFQKQKMDREVIRQKLSMADPDDVDVTYGSDKPWYHPRFERSYSANNQNLQICYINESCSSDDSESDPTSNLSKSSTSKCSSSSTFSPTSSPSFASPRGYGKRYFRQNRLSETSSHSSSSSSLTMSSPTGSDATIIRHAHQQDLRSGRSKQEEMELEARFQLAQAHQKAKLQAEEDRRKSRLESKSSLAHRLLSVTLTDDTNAKIKSYSLTRTDCRSMTLGQLQLILNDMHTKKQGLNDELMKLLMSRDDLQTEQDAKLVDVDDAKALMSSMGPETTV